MKAGDIVLLTRSLLGNDIHAVGVCYEEYGGNSCSFIFENGEYDGFSEEEQKLFLYHVDFSEYISVYEFSNVRRLSNDFYNGRFGSALLISETTRNNYIKKMRDDKIGIILKD